MNTLELEPDQMPKAIINWLYAEYLNEGDPAIADQLVSPEFSGPGGKGPAGFKAAIEPLRRAFPDLHFVIHDMIIEGTRVAVRWTWQGTHEAPFAGVPATGRLITNEGIAIYRVEHGKITASWAQMDRLGVMQQLGAVPTPAKP